MNICSTLITQDYSDNKRGIMPLCYNTMPFLIVINVNWRPQLINVYLPPPGVMLLPQVRVVIGRFNLRVLSQSRKESPSTHIQPSHCLLCCQQFFVALFHDNGSFQIMLFYPLDIQYVKSYNTFNTTNQSRRVAFLRTLYTKINTYCNYCNQQEDTMINITNKTRIDHCDGFDIVHHKKSMYIRINGVFVTNKRGRPKKFDEVQHIKEYIEEQRLALYACREIANILRDAMYIMQDAERALIGGDAS